MHCHCGQRITDLEKEDQKSARAVCLSGHSFYVFLLDDGTLETQWQRQERMKDTFVCNECKRVVTIAASVDTNTGKRKYCNECLDRKIKGRLLDTYLGRKSIGHRKNVNSPWRVPAKVIPEGAWKRDALNPR